MNTKLLVSAIVLCISTLSLSAQNPDHPLIGAQVFVEPGQTPEYIDMLFSRMEDAGMEAGRIRMFGSHVEKPDGTFDFSLYDLAFDAAARHGIKMFITLFPTTDELTDVGGFKFPRSQQHLEDVLRYTRAVVNHFKDHPATYCWVLQNEPGVGGVVNTTRGLAAEKYAQYCQQHPLVRSGYLQADMRPELFTRELTVWYLNTIASVVAECDPVHGRHINPHQILQTIPEYDFEALDITSLGSSMHLSWHFGDFSRNQLTMGVALMSDMIHSAAGERTSWVTEMQGGPVTASGYDVLCPSAAEMEQNIWTALFSGMSGVLFWTLNPRKAVQEAGEWSLLDFNSQPSPRLEAIAAVTSTIKENAGFFSAAKPQKSPVLIAYNKESFWMQHRVAAISRDSSHAGRGRQGVAQSMAAAYSALCSLGFTPEVKDMDETDLSAFELIVLPDMVSLSDRQCDAIREYVENGGTVLMTSQTGYFDEAMSCNFMDEGQPKFDFTGATLKEFAVGDDIYTLSGGLENHYWMGKLSLGQAEGLVYEGEECIACRNSFGKGLVIWFPSMIELGAWNSPDTDKALDRLAEFYRKVLPAGLKPQFRSPAQNVIVRTLTDGENTCVLLINKNRKRTGIRIASLPRGSKAIYGSGFRKCFRRVSLAPESCVILSY